MPDRPTTTPDLAAAIREVLDAWGRAEANADSDGSGDWPAVEHDELLDGLSTSAGELLRAILDAAPAAVDTWSGPAPEVWNEPAEAPPWPQPWLVIDAPGVPTIERNDRPRVHGPECGSEVCCCGFPRAGHYPGEPVHAFVPMGPCDCGAEP